MRRARRGAALGLRSHMSAATAPRRRRTPTQHISISAAHTCYTSQHSRALVRQLRPLLVTLVSSRFAALSRRCRCGRHAHIAGCGTGSRHRLCLGRTHTSVRASVISVASGVISQVIADPGVLWGIAVACGAAIRGPSRPTAWEIVRGKGRVAVPVNIAVVIVAVARPRAADEQLVGGGGDNSGSPPRGPRA